ncbi:MAG: nucleotidyltransferase domain-containing protein, partial [Betaproteobacteria bacterium]|nr:nucleotidyltransferase domain-containing protein [Betaproteobacteria bacterium]
MASLPAVTAAAAPPQSRIGAWKQRLSGQYSQLRQEFFSRKSPAELLRRQTALIDRQLREVWAGGAMPRNVALAAVGGYGRGHQFPHSDVDLLILLSKPSDAPLARKLEELISTLWDIGLEVGHSVRTLDECAALSASDITVQTTLLEARLLAGQRDLYARFARRMRDALDPAAFLQAKLLEQQQRHARYAETNLEPNVKEAAGGLRDLQTILWIARAAGIGKSWRELARRGLITGAEARELGRHEQFLQSLRIRLHYSAGRREDRLLFDFQTALAREFGLHDRQHRLASERLMQRYYLVAKAVSQLNTIVLQNLGARIMPVHDKEYHPINERFGARAELLEAREERLFERQPDAILEGFQLLQQHHELKGVGAATLRALWRARRLINPRFRRDPANRDRFIRILSSPTHVERALRRMNEYGVLGRYLPAFGRIVGQMQHDLYHVYTVDEHILRVV